MATVRVVTDSACDLPAEVVAELAITVVPLTVRFGSEELVDGRDLTPATFWARVASSSVLPETAAPSPGAFEEAFRAAGEAGADAVVCITISSSLSATFQAATLAAQAVNDPASAGPAVTVIDSRSVSMGQGMIVRAAARLAGDGASSDDVVARVNELVPATRVFAALDTLENLKKGGRIGAAQALLGSLLSIKPVIQVTDGKVEPESKQRTRSRSLAYLAEKVRQSQPIDNLAVVHGSAPDVDRLLDLLDGVVTRDQIVVSEVGAVIGTHAGPRVVGVTFTVGAAPA